MRESLAIALMFPVASAIWTEDTTSDNDSGQVYVNYGTGGGGSAANGVVGTIYGEQTALPAPEGTRFSIR